MGNLWIPGLVVLAVGLIAGALLARRFQRGAAPSRADLDLRIGDLEARREELYQRLRAGDLTPDDRSALELAAARVLRDLDETRRAAGLADSAPSGTPGVPPTAARPGADAPSAPPVPAARHGRGAGVILSLM